MLKKHNIYYANYDSNYGKRDDNCVAVIKNDQTLREVEPVNVPVQFENMETKAVLDFGNFCTIFHKNLPKLGCFEQQR